MACVTVGAMRVALAAVAARTAVSAMRGASFGLTFAIGFGTVSGTPAAGALLIAALSIAILPA